MLLNNLDVSELTEEERAEEVARLRNTVEACVRQVRRDLSAITARVWEKECFVEMMQRNLEIFWESECAERKNLAVILEKSQQILMGCTEKELEILLRSEKSTEADKELYEEIEKLSEFRKMANAELGECNEKTKAQILQLQKEVKALKDCHGRKKLAATHVLYEMAQIWEP